MDSCLTTRYQGPVNSWRTHWLLARRRNFYIEVPELARMTPEEVEEYRAELDGVKVRGKNVPKPIRNWHQVSRPRLALLHPKLHELATSLSRSWFKCRKAKGGCCSRSMHARTASC